MIDDILLDKVYRDRITGFEGTAVAKSEFLSGNKRVCLESGNNTCNSVEMWVDISRIEIVDGDRCVGFHSPPEEIG